MVHCQYLVLFLSRHAFVNKSFQIFKLDLKLFKKNNLCHDTHFCFLFVTFVKNK